MIPSSSIEAIFEQQDAAFLLANKTGGAKSMMFIGGYWLEQINPDFAIGSWKQRNLVHQGGEGTEEIRNSNNMELRKSGTERQDFQIIASRLNFPSFS